VFLLLSRCSDARAVPLLWRPSLAHLSCKQPRAPPRHPPLCSPACCQAMYTSVVVALQLWAGGFIHRLLRHESACPSPMAASRFVALALLSPLAEELVYRGALPVVFASRMASSSSAVIVIVPAFFFAAMHTESSRFEALALLHHFAFGCCAGARALAADSTWHAVGLHVANNAAVLCAQTARVESSGGTSIMPATAAYAASACIDMLLMSTRATNK
jgi:membrane protease YdiL (CAAX protease family)